MWWHTNSNNKTQLGQVQSNFPPNYFDAPEVKAQGYRKILPKPTRTLHIKKIQQLQTQPKRKKPCRRILIKSPDFACKFQTQKCLKLLPSELHLSKWNVALLACCCNPLSLDWAIYKATCCTMAAWWNRRLSDIQTQREQEWSGMGGAVTQRTDDYDKKESHFIKVWFQWVTSVKSYKR